MTDDEDDDEFGQWLHMVFAYHYGPPPGWEDGMRTFDQLCEAIGLNPGQDIEPAPAD